MASLVKCQGRRTPQRQWPERRIIWTQAAKQLLSWSRPLGEGREQREVQEEGCELTQVRRAVGGRLEGAVRGESMREEVQRTPEGRQGGAIVHRSHHSFIHSLI